MTLGTDRAVHAVKVALAAGAAWLAVLPFGGVADAYPYYAPLGAVVAFADTVAGSVRRVLSAVVAIAIGAALAVLSLAVPGPRAASLVAVVLVGSWLAYGGWLGSMASWVCTSALFVLIVGGEDPWTYCGAYLGFVTLGALIGLVVDLAWPALPLRISQRRLDSLRKTLAEQLLDLADGLDEDPLPTAGQWHDRRRSIDSRTSQMHRMVEELSMAGHGNWRARPARPAVIRQQRQAEALAHLSFLVNEAFDLISRGEHDGRDEESLGPDLRPRVVGSLRATAEVLADPSDEIDDSERWHSARAATEATARCIRQLQASGQREYFVAASLTTTLRRVLHTLSP